MANGNDTIQTNEKNRQITWYIIIIVFCTVRFANRSSSTAITAMISHFICLYVHTINAIYIILMCFKIIFFIPGSKRDGGVLSKYNM